MTDSAPESKRPAEIAVPLCANSSQRVCPMFNIGASACDCSARSG